LKIAQICPRYFPDIGGVETHVKEISERLGKAGHEVEVVTTDPTGKLKKKETINGVRVIRFRAFAPGNAYYFAPQIYFYLKKHKYDVIHAHSYHALPAFFSSLVGSTGKFVFTPHYHRSGHTPFRDLLHKPYKMFGKRIFSRADSVICVSDYERKLVESDFKVAAKTVKIPNGVNLKEFKDLNSWKNKSEKKSGKEKILLYVGRLEEYKGVQYIIQSLPELEDFRLKVVGKGPYEAELKNLAKNLGIEEKIEWKKDVSRKELLECYADADIFLMLSSHEAYGITVAEALAAGTPCIVAKGSALEEFVDGKNCVGIELPITKAKLIKEVRKMKQGFEVRFQKKLLFDWGEICEETIRAYNR
jgi:glycosyltransferase involved in cell wall biosynthesis